MTPAAAIRSPTHAAPAAAFPEAVRAVLREEAELLALDRDTALESSRLACARLAGLDVVLGTPRCPLAAIVAPGALGGPAIVLEIDPAAVDTFAAAWGEFASVLSENPAANAVDFLTFDNPSLMTGCAPPRRRERGAGAAVGLGEGLAAAISPGVTA